MERNKIRQVYIIDASGSMSGQRSSTVEGFQQDLINLKEEEQKIGNIEYYVTLVSFNYTKQILIDNLPLSQLEDFDFDAVYDTRGGTALNQTVGEILENIPSHEKNVQVVIVTDGQENMSQGEYKDAKVLKAFIEECERRKWAFSFIGANIDSFSTAQNIGISNSINYSESNMTGAYNAVRGSRVAYTCSVSTGGEVNNTGLFRGLENVVDSKTATSFDEIIKQVKTNQTTA